MKKKVLITGGADFIGSHVADELLQYGYQIRALDVLSPQVLGEQRRRACTVAGRADRHRPIRASSQRTHYPRIGRLRNSSGYACAR